MGYAGVPTVWASCRVSWTDMGGVAGNLYKTMVIRSIECLVEENSEMAEKLIAESLNEIS